MKRFVPILVLVAILFSFATVGACPPPPPECPEGQITLEDAEWVDPVYEEQCEWVKHTWWWITWYTWECSDVLVSEGYWTNPVCYVPCSETVAGEKIYGEWQESGEPVFGDWEYDGDTRCRTTGQGFVQEWSQTFYDAQNSELVCDVEIGFNRRGLLGEECEIAECDGMYFIPGELYYDYPCYLNRNPETDSPWFMPERYMKDGVLTDYAQGLCNQKWTCNGWVLDKFNQGEGWEFVCDWKPCLNCE